MLSEISQTKKIVYVLTYMSNIKKLNIIQCMSSHVEYKKFIYIYFYNIKKAYFSWK